MKKHFITKITCYAALTVLSNHTFGQATQPATEDYRSDNVRKSEVPLSEEILIIDPNVWIGKRLDLPIDTDILDQLNHGDWTIIFFHHDCSLCVESVEKYKKTGGHLLFVEIPPLAPKGKELITESPQWLIARLPTERTWFFPMLTRVQTSDGIIIKVWNDTQ